MERERLLLTYCLRVGCHGVSFWRDVVFQFGQQKFWYRPY